MPDLDLSFSWTANAQSLSAAPKQVRALTEGYASLIVEEVALGSIPWAVKEIRQRLVTSVKSALSAEVSRMAMAIGRYFVMPESATGPRGQMSIREGMSVTYQRMGFQQTFLRESSGIRWSPRSKGYVDRKHQNLGHARWWEASGELADFFGSRSGDFYEEVFGPIRVLFRPAKQRRDRLGRFSAMGQNKVGSTPMDPGSFDAGNRSLLKRTDGSVNVTRSGRAGRLSFDYEVGSLEVSVFGKITPQMLPALATPDWNPAKSKPTGGDGLAGLFPDDGEGGIRNKLLGRQAVKRYALEPFVAFYLTRAIPNALWRRTEQLVGESGV